MTIHDPEDVVEGRSDRVLGWLVDVVLGAATGLLAGFLAMIAVQRVGWGLWSVLPPIGVLGGMSLMRWDRDRTPHSGRHRTWVSVGAAVTSVASVVFFVALALAISRFE